MYFCQQAEYGLVVPVVGKAGVVGQTHGIVHIGDYPLVLSKSEKLADETLRERRFPPQAERSLSLPGIGIFRRIATHQDKGIPFSPMFLHLHKLEWNNVLVGFRAYLHQRLDGTDEIRA